jgi:PKD repeat protein
VFTASASGGTGPYTYAWDLGDSSTAVGQVTTHTYNSTGTYTASLTVGDMTGTSVTSSQIVTIGNTLALHVKDSQIVDNGNNTVSLVGLNYGDYPNDVYPNQFNTGNLTRDAIDIRNAGFNVVNLVEEWANLEHSTSPSTFAYDTAAWSLMQARMTALTHQGIYTIIKLHADSESQANLDTLLGFLGRGQYCASKGDFLTSLSDSFYSHSANSNPNSGIAHLTNLWLKMSNVTRNNSLVIGFDLLNEPWVCSNSSLSKSQVHDYWHSRVSEITSLIRQANDNRIIFVEEAPNYYGLQYFQPYSDANTVTSIHWYRGAYKPGSGSYTACNSEYATLYGYFSNVKRSGNGECSSQEADFIVQAQHKYPDQAFMIGEFGNIYGNKQGDNSQQWIQESIHLFKDQHMAGWIYWSSGDKGSWLGDLHAGTVSK